MAISFPASPSLGNTYTVGTKTWIYNGYAWDLKTVNLSWTTKTGNYTANIGDAIFADTSGGPWTLTLPASPYTGTQVYVADSAGTWAANNLTIGRNSQTIMGLAENLICNIKDTSISLVYNGTTWRLV